MKIESETANRCEIYFDELLVGSVEILLCSDATWHGVFESKLKSNQESAAGRVAAFIEFCIGWHERLRAGEAEVSEFDKYSDISIDNHWTARFTDRSVQRIESAPVFFQGNEISWRIR